MCGIAGIINLKENKTEEPVLRRMMELIRHRGPDDDGLFMHGGVGLGFVRLSILDLSPLAHQPMVSDDGNTVMVFNGEIYNYIEIREELRGLGHTFKSDGDSEVLLKAFLQWGEDCLNRLNGMWAFVIYDKVKEHIFASRDRFGIKPFYYTYDGRQFVFASEIPPVLSALRSRPLANKQAIFDYLVFNRTDHGTHTFFKDVIKLKHGCSLTIDLKSVDPKPVTKTWYDLRKNLKSPVENPGEYYDLFSSAVGLHLRSDVPVGVCFSGGLDSSSIVSVLLKDHRCANLNTFSAVYEKGESGDESSFIDLYKDKPLKMHLVTPKAADLYADIEKFTRIHAEPIPSTSPYAQYKVMELARNKVKVTLDGQGADEQLGGYHYFFGLFFKDLLLRGRIVGFCSEISAYMRRHRSLYGLKTLVYFLLPEKIRTATRVKERGYLKKDFVSGYKASNTVAGSIYASPNLQEALLDHFEYKLEHLLKWEDRNSMQFSIEARVPFLDYRLVEKTLSLHSAQIIKNGTTKHVLREAMRGVVPEQIRMRMDKVGFGTPEASWFREPFFRDYILQLLSSESFKKRDIIDPDVCKKLYRRHLEKKIDISQEIWKWINLELWHRQYIDP